MDEETREGLEQHVKKKTVQGRRGMPFVVISSLRHFRAVEEYRLERAQQKATPKLERRPVRAMAPNPLDAPPSSPAKHLQGVQGIKACSFLHPEALERTKKPALSPPPRVQLGRNWAAFQQPQGSQVSTQNLRPLHAPPMAERTSVPGEPHDPKGGVFEGEAHGPDLPLLILKHRGEKELPANPEQLLRWPSSKKPPKLPPSPVAPTPKARPPGEKEALQRPTSQGRPPSPTTSAPEVPLEPPGKEEAVAGRGDGRGGMAEAGGLQLELVMMQSCMTLSPSEEKDVEPPEPPLEPPGRDEAEETQPQRDSSSRVPSLALKGEGVAAPAPGAEGGERVPGTKAFLPPSVQGKAGARKKRKRPRPERKRSQPSRRGTPPPFVRERAAAGDGRKAGSRRECRQRGPPRPSSTQRRAEGGQTRARPKPGCIPWHSLCPCLVLAKEKAKQAMNRLIACLRCRHP